MSPKLSIITAAGLLAFSFAELATAEDIELPQEKCYCIAKARHNDCAGKLHDCAGKSVKDFDCNDWKYVASGSCEEIGGSLVAGKQPPK